jgi:hypothetical protein
MQVFAGFWRIKTQKPGITGLIVLVFKDILFTHQYYCLFDLAKSRWIGYGIINRLYGFQIGED